MLEFARTLDSRPELVTWRQGRCLAYGDASGFAALSDILKGHAAILDSDEPVNVEDKLEAVLTDGNDKSWLRQRLRPLLGLESAPASQEENFAAWTELPRTPRLGRSDRAHRRGRALGRRGDARLPAASGEGGSSRPQRSCWSRPGPRCSRGRRRLLGDARACTRLSLSPLTRREAARLVAHLLGRQLAPEVCEPVVEQVGGNPLYAEEYVRLLLDRGVFLRSGGLVELKQGETLPLPRNVHAVLAARLDTLAPEHKALLCDAAVMGESFWDGGVVALADRGRDEVTAALATLVERQLLREGATSTLAGETEYLFWHALTRDVAYGELPKRVRVVKHRAALSWLEVRSEGRGLEFAERLSYHAITALELAREVGEQAVAKELRLPAIRHLVTAADLAMSLDLASAESHYACAAGLLADEEPAPRAEVLVKWAEALDGCMRRIEAVQRLDEAVALLRTTDDKRELALALTELSRKRAYTNFGGVDEPILEALDVLQADPCPELVTVLGRASLYQSVQHSGYATAARLAEDALRLAAELGLPSDGVSLEARAEARLGLGDRAGLDDYREAIVIARERGLILEACRMQTNLGIQLGLYDGPGPQEACYQHALEWAVQSGSRSQSLDAQTLLCEAYYLKGDWNLLSDSLAELIPVLADAGDLWNLVMPHAFRVLLSLEGRRREDSRDSEKWLAQWVRKGIHGDRPLCIVPLAALAFSRDERGVALHLLEQELAPETLDGNYRMNLASMLTTLGRLSAKLGRPHLAKDAVAQIYRVTPFYDNQRATLQALVEEAEGRTAAACGGFAAAAARWHDFGVPYEEAQALLGQGRCLAALGRAPEAAAPLSAARDILTPLGATAAIAETESLLAAVSG